MKTFASSSTAFPTLNSLLCIAGCDNSPTSTLSQLSKIGKIVQKNKSWMDPKTAPRQLPEWLPRWLSGWLPRWLLASFPWYVWPDLHSCHKWHLFLYFRELCLWQIPRLDEKLNKNTMEEKQKAKLLKAFHWRPKSTRKLSSLSSSSFSTCSSARVYSEQSDRLCDVKANTWNFSIGTWWLTPPGPHGLFWGENVQVQKTKILDLNPPY